ncbi:MULTISPECIES: hypothetical protein [Cupriavidus]
MDDVVKGERIPMSEQRKQIDLRDVLKQRVDAGEPIFITGAGSSAEIEAMIEDLAKETGKTVRVVQTVEARVVPFDEPPETDDATQSNAIPAGALKP